VQAIGIGMTARVVELLPEEELQEAFPVFRQSHGELDDRRYEDLLVPYCYCMFAVREPSGEIAAVLGMQILINLYYERHAYVYDLVVSEDLARRERCRYVACGSEREEVLRCYEDRGYERLATPFARAWADIWRPSFSDLVQLA
jgi:hypothetical protein